MLDTVTVVYTARVVTNNMYSVYTTQGEVGKPTATKYKQCFLIFSIKIFFFFSFVRNTLMLNTK